MKIYTTVTDAWFNLLKEVLFSGKAYRQDIQRGSFEKQAHRLQLPFVACAIENPLADYVPSVPDGVAPPNSKEYVESYFCDYIMGGLLPSENEEYTYAQRIGPQLQIVLDMLEETPYTNQATIEIGRPSDITSSEPACLRVIDFKVVLGKLELSTFWRSNDLWAGFPTNLGAIAMLQNLVAESIGVEPGRMNYSSSGLHLYSYQISSALAKLGKTKQLEK